MRGGGDGNGGLSLSLWRCQKWAPPQMQPPPLQEVYRSVPPSNDLKSTELPLLSSCALKHRPASSWHLAVFVRPQRLPEIRRRVVRSLVHVRVVCVLLSLLLVWRWGVMKDIVHRCVARLLSSSSSSSLPPLGFYVRGHLAGVLPICLQGRSGPSSP